MDLGFAPGEGACGLVVAGDESIDVCPELGLVGVEIVEDDVDSRLGWAVRMRFIKSRNSMRRRRW